MERKENEVKINFESTLASRETQMAELKEKVRIILHQGYFVLKYMILVLDFGNKRN